MDSLSEEPTAIRYSVESNLPIVKFSVIRASSLMLV